MTERDRTHGQTCDELDTMPGPGLRSDQAGASGSLAGPAPKGGDPEAPHPTETRWDPDVPAGDGRPQGAASGPGATGRPRAPVRASIRPAETRKRTGSARPPAVTGPLGRQFLKRALADKI